MPDNAGGPRKRKCVSGPEIAPCGHSVFATAPERTVEAVRQHACGGTCAICGAEPATHIAALLGKASLVCEACAARIIASNLSRWEPEA
jgi:hypothetical protein